jgi:hypothetical protein
MGAPGDRFELEADAMADRVVERMHTGAVRRESAPVVQAQCAECQEEEEEVQRQTEHGRTGDELLQAKADGSMAVPESVQQTLPGGHGGGQAMPPALRDEMEFAFETDFSDVRAHTGASAENLNRDLRARAFTYGTDIYFNAGEYRPETLQGRHLLAHELTHVVQQGAAAPVIQRDGAEVVYDDPFGTSWYAAERARQAELEAAETGPGRETTLDRLASMSDGQARREASGIAYRAQGRGDIHLATQAAARLLAAWLASRDIPGSFSAAFGSEDAVDAVLAHAETAFAASHLELGGHYLAIAIVQLVRAAAVAVGRRGDTDDNPGVVAARALTLPLQRSTEREIVERVERARAILERQGRTVAARRDAAEIARFETVAKGVTAAERRAGPTIAEDLGTGGVVDVPEPPARAEGGARRPSVSPPPRQEAAPATPLSRAEVSILNSTPPDLEGALVFYTRGPMRYANIRSPRHAIAGTIAGAQELASQLFGRTSAVIVEDVGAHDPITGRRQARYVVAALNTRLNAPDRAVGEMGPVGLQGIEMLSQPASRQYFFLAIVTGDWLFYPPSTAGYIGGVQASEARLLRPGPGGEETRRQAVFGPIDQLLTRGETQEAANQLTAIGAAGFALVDTATKTRYVVVLLKAYTLETHEKTVVEIFRTLGGRDELRAILAGLHQAGVLRQLHADLQSAFPSLLVVVGQRLGMPSLTPAAVRALLSELRVFTPIPGLEIRADGSVQLASGGAEVVAAVEGLINTITSAVTGIIDILFDPEAFVRGIGQLVYIAVMMELAKLGYPPAVLYVSRLIDGIARQLGLATAGLAALQQNVPAGAEFVRDIQRSIEWRVLWEVVSLFVGVGEAVALVNAIRGGRVAAGVADMVSSLSRLGRGAGLLEGAAGARLLRFATAIEGRTASEAHVLAVLGRLPETERARLARLLGEVDDLAKLSEEGRQAVRAVRANADTLAELQAHLGGDMSRATALWARLDRAGLNGPAVSRLLVALPQDAAARARTLRAVEGLAELPGVTPGLVESVAGSTTRLEAVENIGAANYAMLWRRADGDAARADALLSALSSRRGADPAAFQRSLEELRNPESRLWRDLEDAAGPAPRSRPDLAATRRLEHGASLRRGPDGRRWICFNPCAELEHLRLPDDVIDAAVRNIPASMTGDLVETLSVFRRPTDIPAVESLVNQLARGGDEAASAVDVLERITQIRQIEGLSFHLPDLVAAHRRGDAVLAHRVPQTPRFLEDILWRNKPIGRYEIQNGRLVFPDRPELAGVGLPSDLRKVNFVIIEGEGGTSRLVLGFEHSGLSGGRPWVFGAGEMELSKTGEIIRITNGSGHYRPAPGNAARVRDFLRERNILGPRGVFAESILP